MIVTFVILLFASSVLATNSLHKTSLPRKFISPILSPVAIKKITNQYWPPSYGACIDVAPAQCKKFKSCVDLHCC